MTHPHYGDDPFPRGPLVGAALLIMGAVLAVTAVRVSGVGTVKVADAAAVAVRDFRFEDRADGSIAVIDPRDGKLVEVVSGTHGFMRGTLRGLARERRRMGIGSDQPFKLIGRADGRLTLEDPATGRRVDLESFGPANAVVFASLLAYRGDTP